MAKKVKKEKKERSCNNCLNCIPIGEGDHICTEFEEPILVLSGYIPTDDYNKCNGTKWEDK